MNEKRRRKWTAGEKLRIGNAYVDYTVQDGRLKNLRLGVGINYRGSARIGFLTGGASRRFGSPKADVRVAGERLADRKQLLNSFDNLRRDIDTRQTFDGLDAYQSKALEMVVSGKVRDVRWIELFLEALQLHLLRLGFGRQPQFDLALGHDPARRDRVEPDVVGAEIAGEAARHADRRRLGEGAELEKLKALASHLDIEHRVQFVGRLSDQEMIENCES